MRVLFLCHGNINRSAAAEIILRTMAPADWKIKSAALKGTNGGEITTKKMRYALRIFHYPSEGIRSQPVTQELIDWADIIFYMDSGNRTRLESRFGLGKAVCLADYINKASIPDPQFHKGTCKHLATVALIAGAIRRWLLTID